MTKIEYLVHHRRTGYFSLKLVNTDNFEHRGSQLNKTTT